jgi:hypothetical protein
VSASGTKVCQRQRHGIAHGIDDDPVAVAREALDLGFVHQLKPAGAADGEYAVERLSCDAKMTTGSRPSRRRSTRWNGELSRLTACASGADFEALLVAISERERTRTRLQRERDMLRETAKAPQIEPTEVRTKLMARLAEWRNLLRKETLWSRQIITKLLDGKITLTPTHDESGTSAYEMQAKLSLGGLFSGILYPMPVLRQG